MTTIYGQPLYGTALYLGSASITSPLLWSFVVDWDNDGYFSGENEANQMVDLHLIRGRDNYIGANGIEQYKPGKITATFDNSDGRYDPWYTSSPLYPNVKPGPIVRVLVKDTSTGLNYNVMRGYITDIQLFSRGGRQFANIVVSDVFEWLRNTDIYLAKSENATFGANIKRILDASNIPADWSYSTSNTGNSIPFHWANQQNALAAVRELELAEVGTLRHLRTGSISWSIRTTAPASTTTITEDEILRDVSLPMPWQVVVNSCTVDVNELTSHNITTTLWALEEEGLEFAANETKTFKVGFRHPTLNIPVIGDNIEPFVIDSNYIATQFPPPYNPLYTSLPMTITVTVYGTEGTLSIYNPQDYTVYLHLFEIIGDAVYAQYEMAVTSEDAASIATYGKKSIRIISPFMQRESIANTIAAGFVSNLSTPGTMPIIKIENRPALQFGLDLYINAIRLQLPTKGLDETYRIGRIEHKWLRENGNAVVTTYNLEPVLSW